MTIQRYKFQSSAFALILFLAGCQRFTIQPTQLSIQELAEVVGVSSFCAETHYSSPCYARLVMTSTDSNGKHREEVSTPSADKNYRLRVLNICDPNSHSIQLIRYQISAQNSGGAEERFIYIPSESSFQGSTTNNFNAFLYEIVLKKGTEKTTIHIELETGAAPFPKTSSLE